MRSGDNSPTSQREVEGETRRYNRGSARRTARKAGKVESRQQASAIGLPKARRKGKKVRARRRGQGRPPGSAAGAAHRPGDMDGCGPAPRPGASSAGLRPGCLDGEGFRGLGIPGGRLEGDRARRIFPPRRLLRSALIGTALAARRFGLTHARSPCGFPVLFPCPGLIPPPFLTHGAAPCEGLPRRAGQRNLKSRPGVLDYLE